MIEFILVVNFVIIDLLLRFCCIVRWGIIRCLWIRKVRIVELCLLRFNCEVILSVKWCFSLEWFFLNFFFMLWSKIVKWRIDFWLIEWYVLFKIELLLVNCVVILMVWIECLLMVYLWYLLNCSNVWVCWNGGRICFKICILWRCCNRLVKWEDLLSNVMKWFVVLGVRLILDCWIILCWIVFYVEWLMWWFKVFVSFISCNMLIRFFVIFFNFCCVLLICIGLIWKFFL